MTEQGRGPSTMSTLDLDELERLTRAVIAAGKTESGESPLWGDWYEAVDQPDTILALLAIARREERLRLALERLLANSERIFDKVPVRDWAETLAEARAALTPEEGQA